MEIDQVKEALLLASTGDYSKLYKMMVIEYVKSYSREQLISHSIRFNEEGMLNLKKIIMEALQNIDFKMDSPFEVKLVDFDMERREIQFEIKSKEII